MGYAALYSEDVVTHHRAFIARRRGLRPAEEYRDLSPEEWDQFLSHFELRKVVSSPATSPSQPSRRASVMRSWRLSRISTRRCV